MARYTGPRDKVSRRFGVALFGSTKALEKRPFPPGQHGMRAGRKKKSDYGDDGMDYTVGGYGVKTARES